MKKVILIILTICALVSFALLLLSGLAVYVGKKQSTLLAAAPKHGTLFVIAPDLSQAQGDANALANLRESMRLRFSRFGARIFWETLAGSRVRIIATVTDARDVAAARDMVSRGGHLEFRLVHPDSDQLVLNGQVPGDYELLTHQETVSGQQRTNTVIVKRESEAGLTTNIIKSAFVMRDQAGRPQIDFELTPTATAAFAEVTRANIGHRLAIVLDGRLYSAPVVQSPIETGMGQITGSFDSKEALMLSALMQYPLPVPVTNVEVKTF